MTEKHIIPASEAQVETKVSNSTFIATAKPTFTVDEAKAFIEDVRNRFSDATHNVPVFIIGHPPSVIEHSSDDGEPAGTAGRPALSVLRGSGLGDIAVVITRYFGGTKLGTGGLVRAYSDAMRSVLAEIPKAVKLATVTAELKISYPLYEPAQRLVEIHAGIILEQVFEIEVTMRIKFRSENFEPFQDDLLQLTNGQLIAQIVQTDPDDIFPLDL